MVTRLRPRLQVIPLIVLTILWVMLVGEITLGNVLAGILLAVVVTVALPLPPLPVTVATIRPLSLVWLLVTVALSLVTSSWRVAKIAFSPAPPPPCALVVIDYPIDDDVVAAFGVILLNLQPGGTVTRIDRVNHTITMHLLDGSSTQKVEQEKTATARFAQQLIHAFGLDRQATTPNTNTSPETVAHTRTQEDSRGH